MADRDQRKLAAIFVADLVGYSRLTEADEAGTLRRLKAAREQVIDLAIGEFGGRIVHTAGDGVLSEFPSVVDAVQCAANIQNAMIDHGRGEPEDPPLRFRIGVNLGDVMIDGDDLHGSGVNIAARLQEIAAPGAVCISETVYNQIRDETELDWESDGEHTLKNIERPIRVWHWFPAGMAAQKNDSDERGSQGLPSIAVLPFTNLSTDPDQDFFADGMTEDVITLLSTVPDLFVIARNSTIEFKGQTPDVREVATALGVRYVLEGSVRKAGNRIRVTAQLVDAISGSQIWGERYDRDLDDIFAVQDELAQGIVGAAQSPLLVAESSRASRKPTNKLDAWGNLVKARITMYAYRRQDMDAAEPFVRRALKIQPDYAPAHALLSLILAWRFYNGEYNEENLEVARTSAGLAARALELEANNPTVLVDIGYAYSWLGLFTRAATLAERALKLNPNSALNCAIAGAMLALVGRTDEGTALARKALVLSPRDPLAHMFHRSEGWTHYFAGNLETAKTCLQTAIGMKADPALERTFVAAILVRQGNKDLARRELDRVIQQGSRCVIENVFRARTTGTLWREFTDPIREIYDGPLPEHPDE
ncbi:MAG: hypothetical protein HKN05_05520 [Rhizobiales bacterium]|nr:hypothetical protein [Hyphomicrobiales bacterium]